MTFDPRYVVRAGQTYLIPASMEEGWMHYLTLEEIPTCSDWLCLCLETGEQQHVADFFFEPSRRVA